MNRPRRRPQRTRTVQGSKAISRTGAVKPERLDMLEFGGEEAFEIVFDDEDAEEIWIAAGAEDVPGKRGQAEGGDGGWMKEAEGIAPTFREECPEEDGAAARE